MATPRASLDALISAHGLPLVLAELVRSEGLLLVLEGLANVEGDVAESCMKRAENGSAYDHSRAASVIVQAVRYIACGSHGVVSAQETEPETQQQPTEPQPKKRTRARSGVRA